MEFFLVEDFCPVILLIESIGLSLKCCNIRSATSDSIMLFVVSLMVVIDILVFSRGTSYQTHRYLCMINEY